MGLYCCISIIYIFYTSCQVHYPKENHFKALIIFFWTSILSLFSWISPIISIFLFSCCSYPIPSLFCTQTHECSWTTCVVLTVQTVVNWINRLMIEKFRNFICKYYANWINCLMIHCSILIMRMIMNNNLLTGWLGITNYAYFGYILK